MITLACGRTLTFAVACLCVAHVACGHARALVESQEHASEVQAVKVDDKMSALAERFLRKGYDAPKRNEIVEASEGKVDLAKAASRLQGKLPTDVASLVSMGVEQKAGAEQDPNFTEESMAKARKVLNELIVKAWKELDHVLINCKEFEDRNRATFEQVMTDIARLAEQIADNERVKAESIEQIQVKDREIAEVAAKLKEEHLSYMRIYLQNAAEMKIRKADMAVFEFMVKLTECKSTAFIQLADGKHNHGHRGPQLCEDEHGLRLNFEDEKTQREVEARMTPTARQEMTAALQRVQALEEGGNLSFLQEDLEKLTMRLTSTTTFGKQDVNTGTQIIPKVKVQKDPGSGNTIKCTGKVPDCGLLNDNFSLLWGKFKDLVDELQMEMDKNAFEWKILETNLNDQIDGLRGHKQSFIEKLNEAIANMNADREEMSEKEDERRTLEHEYKAMMKHCKIRIEWIVYQDICAFLGIRAAVLKTSTECKPKDIIDCDWSVYMPGPCSVSCDDSCPDPNPFNCGGWQKLARERLVQPNSCGFACPDFSGMRKGNGWDGDRKGYIMVPRKCGQFKCPVDCLMSKWSPWAGCSTVCGGGVQGRTRNVIEGHEPRNGGLSCNTAQESRACNTGSCDRNCRLKKWSKWSPCSVACNGGFQERWRRVLIPIRGNGRCPKPQSRYRYRIKKCNTHSCNGDEVCVAKQDLVMAIDASGSLRDFGFKIVKGFAAKLIDNYKGEYFGYEDMRIGVVQFGNGKVEADGTVSNAIPIMELTNKMADVKTAIEGLVYKKGFTNMAQAFTVAEGMFLRGGRKEAQSAVMTITDGKPSFLFQTFEKVKQLKDKHVKLFFAPITGSKKSDEMKLMKKWASSPWPTHIERLPGLQAVAADEGMFVQKVLVKFCPEAISPSAMVAEEQAQGYLLVRQNGFCGNRFRWLGRYNKNVDDCAEKARNVGMPGFVVGIRWAKGYCWASNMAVTKEQFKAIQENRIEPECTTGWRGPYNIFDMYVLYPAVEV